MEPEDDAKYTRFLRWNISEKITWAMLVGMGIIGYWGITAKIEETAGNVCGCGDYIRQNARMIRQLVEEHEGVETNGELPLDLNSYSDRRRALDAPKTRDYRLTDRDYWFDHGACGFDTGPKIYEERRHRRDDG